MKVTSIALLALTCNINFTTSSIVKPLQVSSQVSSRVSQLVADKISAQTEDARRALRNGTPCGLCADGSKYTIEGTLPPSSKGDGRVTTCAEVDAVAQRMNANDPLCAVIHIAGRHCGCPHVTPEGACTLCYDGSPVESENILDTSTFELTGLDVTIKDLGLPDGSGAAVSCGEVETNLHTLHVLSELADSNTENVEITKEGNLDYDETLAFLCTFFQNLAGPQCGCPADPDAELCVACAHGVLEPDKVTNLSPDVSLTCGEAHELIKPIPPGQLCDQMKARPPPGCMCNWAS